MKPYSLPVSARRWSSIAEKVSEEERPTSMPRCRADSTDSICACRATRASSSASAAEARRGAACTPSCPGSTGTSPGNSFPKPDIRSPRIRKQDKRAS